MSSVIRIKRRASGGSAGAPSALKNSELAYNENDNTLYYGFGDDGSGNATSFPAIAGKGAYLDLTSSQTIGGTKTFSSSPVVPTPSALDNSTKAASTAYVDAAVSLAAGSVDSVNGLTGVVILDTDDVSEGGTNKYFSASAAKAAAVADAIVNGVTDVAPSQNAVFDALALKVDSTLLGSSNGVATLDSNGKLPSSQLTIEAFEYKGAYNATTNSPTLVDGTGSTGDLYRVTTAGSQNFGAGSITFAIGDKVAYNGSTWEKWDVTESVSSVFGRAGIVTAQTGDYNSDQITEGSTNIFFTQSRVRSAVLTGLSLVTAQVIAATDTVLQALGYLQAQITLRLVASNNLSDLANASTARTNLGLGTMAVQNASAVSITGGTIDSTTITNSSFDGGSY